jgi:hypothetical protein
MIKKYSFDYNSGEASACFTVDTDMFTPEVARTTLEFYTWDYDAENDPIDEVLKKYALEVIKILTTKSCSIEDAKAEFEEYEGFCRLDGSVGIELTKATGYRFDEDYLKMTVETK